MTYPHERAIDSFRSSTARWLFGSFAGWGTLLLCFVGVGLLILGWRWLRNFSSSYEVTDQRLIIRRGILIKTVDEIELYRIKDVRLEYSLLNQMVDIGTIALTSSDPSTVGGAFVLRDVPMARDRREGLRGLVERARQRRGVRELDMDPVGTPALAG
ncbi:PH domain-containing protein [Sphingomonas lenta]|nr:PH domain-containing protein [Sphingomonas lenta]